MDDDEQPSECPFCSKPTIVQQWKSGARVACPNHLCPVQPVGKIQPTRERAIIVWNLRRRAAPRLAPTVRMEG